MDHLFDEGEDGRCRTCGEPYTTPDERHDYGKVWWFDEGNAVRIEPYTKRHYIAEMREMYG